MSGSDERAQSHTSFAPEEAKQSQPSERVIRSATPDREIGGREGPDPVRYGDWEKAGRCIDF
jgi:hypothetical protein